MAAGDLPTEILLERLETLANSSLNLWEMVPENATARLINVSENTTYLVEAPGWKSVLRIHRENYHTETAINCELSWSFALNQEGVIVTPEFYRGRDGKAVQSAVIDGLPAPRHMVMFHFVDGCKPDENQNLAEHFEELGEISACTHNHSISWSRPELFDRPEWNLKTIFGANSIWGNWRDAPHVTVDIQKNLTAGGRHRYETSDSIWKRVGTVRSYSRRYAPGESSGWRWRHALN